MPTAVPPSRVLHYRDCERCRVRYLSRGQTSLCHNCRTELRLLGRDAACNTACGSCGTAYFSASGATRLCPVCRGKKGGEGQSAQTGVLSPGGTVLTKVPVEKGAVARCPVSSAFSPVAAQGSTAESGAASGCKGVAVSPSPPAASPDPVGAGIAEALHAGAFDSFTSLERSPSPNPPADLNRTPAEHVAHKSNAARRPDVVKPPHRSTKFPMNAILADATPTTVDERESPMRDTVRAQSGSLTGAGYQDKAYYEYTLYDRHEQGAPDSEEADRQRRHIREQARHDADSGYISDEFQSHPEPHGHARAEARHHGRARSFSTESYSSDDRRHHRRRNHSHNPRHTRRRDQSRGAGNRSRRYPHTGRGHRDDSYSSDGTDYRRDSRWGRDYKQHSSGRHHHRGHSPSETESTRSSVPDTRQSRRHIPKQDVATGTSLLEAPPHHHHQQQQQQQHHQQQQQQHRPPLKKEQRDPDGPVLFEKPLAPPPASVSAAVTSTSSSPTGSYATTDYGYDHRQRGAQPAAHRPAPAYAQHHDPHAMLQMVDLRSGQAGYDDEFQHDTKRRYYHSKPFHPQHAEHPPQAMPHGAVVQAPPSAQRYSSFTPSPQRTARHRNINGWDQYVGDASPENFRSESAGYVPGVGGAGGGVSQARFPPQLGGPGGVVRSPQAVWETGYTPKQGRRL